MSKKIALDFGQYPPRWIKDQEVIEQNKDREDFIVNPKLNSKLKSLNPYRWKLRNGSIVAMSEEEAEKKLRQLEKKEINERKRIAKKRELSQKQLEAARSRYAFAAYLALFISSFVLGLELYENRTELLELYNVIQEQLRRLYVSLFS